jgi:GTP-binding protein
MFIDEVRVNFRGGTGGTGCKSMLRQKYVPRGGPDGGNGGKGADVILVATTALNTLNSFGRKRHFHAQNGANGSSTHKYGAGGEDMVVEVPAGTVVKTDEGEVLADLVLPGETYVAASGGRGGRGNAALVTKTNPLPRYAEKGEPGQDRWLVLELKLVADVGLVGFPNAGKSTLISRTSAARPKIADYPFTTVVPNLGVVSVDQDTHFVMADIPGLIEGAADGKGLGLRFLRHVERCRIIVHLLDMTGWDDRDPATDYKILRKELAKYSAKLTKKPEIIVGNKMDVTGAEKRLAAVSKKLKKKVVGISAATGAGVKELMRAIATKLAKLPVVTEREEVVHRFEMEPDFMVTKAAPGEFVVTGKRVETLILMTHLENQEAVEVLGRKLKRMGLNEELGRAGAQTGDSVRIGAFEFEYNEED